MAKQHDLVSYWRDRALQAEARLALIQSAFNAVAAAEITSSAADAEPDVLLGLEWNATRVLSRDEETEALRHFRPLP